MVLLKVGETGEFVADFDFAVFVWFEEEADVAVVDDGGV